MAYAGDRLYNEVIRKMMGDLATKVKVREVIARLPCLTLSDREEIEAKRETCGNFSAIMLLLENLQRRENWPDQFISALRECEQRALANEIHEAYDRIRGIHTQRTSASSAPVPPDAATSVSPAAPPAPAPAATAAPSPAPYPAEASAKVTTASIHSAPHSIPPLLTPSMENLAQSATPPINSPPGPNSNIFAPASTEGPASVSASGAPVHPPPESAHPTEPPLLVLSSGARPPSLVSAPTLTPTIGQSEIPVSLRETSTLGISDASAPINSSPESCSKIASPALTKAPASVQPPREPAHPIEPPLLGLAPNAMPPSPVSAPKVTPSVGQSEIPVSSREPSPLGISGGLTNTALSGPSSVAAPTRPINSISTSSQVNKPSTTSQSSNSPEKNKVPLCTGSVKHPIQDTSPPGFSLLAQDSDNPANNQVVEKADTAVFPNCQTQETVHASASASSDAVDGITAENEEYFSKPDVLRESEPFSVSSDPLQISHMTRECSPNHPAMLQANPHRAEEPVAVSVSFSTDDLMISSSTAAVQSSHVSDLIAPVQNSTRRAMENGLPEGDSNSYPNQPVEDHYESVHQRLQAEPETRIHIVEYSEGKSVQNLSGQSPSMAGPTTIGLSHNDETESLVQSVSEDQCSQGISQYMEGNNSSEQASLAAGLTTCVEPAPSTRQGSELNASSQINIPQSGQREEGVLHQLKSNSHLIAAAAIGMTAVFVALRLRP